MTGNTCPCCGQPLPEPAKADKAIERYYRVKAAGGKTTIREVAVEFGLSDKYLRKRKVEYDRLGKWGSKSKVKGA